MRTLFTLSLSLILFQASYAQQWYKGNLHTHSYWSDGDDFPEMIMDWYKSHGYHFVGLSDHNILAEGEKWKLIPNSYAHRQGFQKYLDKYGEEWVEYEKDADERIRVRLKTLAQYRPLFEEEGKFLVIQSEEVTDQFEDKHIHMNVTNVQSLIEPQHGNSVTEVMQNNINAINRQRQESRVPMFPHINHPNFIWSITVDDMIPLSGERFFEVYNGHPMVNNYGDSTRLGMEKIWDILITNYLRDQKPVMYGLATDDAHSYHIYGGDQSNPGRGWVMVKAEELSAEALIKALEAGDFYSTTGVELESIVQTDNRLSVKVKKEGGINYRIQFWGSKKGASRKDMGVLLQEVEGLEASYQLQEDELYVRAKIISTKPKINPFQEGDFEVAWTQPVVR
ncbi:histidinol-phosphatase [Porifericola rhodea]|uniref:histidinol-phosphatase n=1 Tax=Porifericola rhodea TaxID=930972 RepID=UPI002664ED37|nr:histidinol-phosphatase [Porifericola rhodea]WKN32849.1 histidinol-phosphatase [Porifericola rhodea]